MFLSQIMQWLYTLGWRCDAMPRFSDIYHKLIPDTENHQPIKSMITGGIYMLCKGYPEANNKFLKSCDANKPTPYTIYLDVNNFYRHSMM